jgi:hypothetical protein
MQAALPAPPGMAPPPPPPMLPLPPPPSVVTAPIKREPKSHHSYLRNHHNTSSGGGERGGGGDRERVMIFVRQGRRLIFVGVLFRHTATRAAFSRTKFSMNFDDTGV